jgi:hypothetical protein
MAASKLILTLAAAALAAVARADYMTFSYFTGATCATKVAYAVQNGICAPAGSGTWTLAASCADGNIKVFSTSGCTGTPVATYTFAQALGGAANTCNTVAAGVLFTATTYVKYACVASSADPTTGDLPTGIATIMYTDSTCSTKFAARINQYCQGAGSGASAMSSCRPTQSYSAYYSYSTTCDGPMSPQLTANLKTTCSLDSTSQLYTTEACIIPTCTAGSTYSDYLCATCDCKACSTAGPGQRVTTACTTTSNAVIAPCAAKTYSPTGSQTNVCMPCSDANAVSNYAFTACECAMGYSPTSAGPNPSCGANSAPYKGYMSVSTFTNTACSGTAMSTSLQNTFSSGCTKESGSSPPLYTYQSCIDVNTKILQYYTDAACSIPATYPYPSISTLTCSSGSLSTCVMGAFPDKIPAATGNNILATHFSASATCTGAIDTFYTTPVTTYGGCIVSPSGTTSYSYSCKNNLPSRTDYTDAACSVGGKTSGPAAACMADTGSGATGSTLASCTGGTTTSGAASTAASVVAAVAAVAAAVALA